MHINSLQKAIEFRHATNNQPQQQLDFMTAHQNSSPSPKSKLRKFLTLKIEKIEGEVATNRVKNSGLNASLLEIESTEKARHATANNSNHRVGRNRNREVDLFLSEALLENRTPGSAIRRFPSWAIHRLSPRHFAFIIIVAVDQGSWGGGFWREGRGERSESDGARK